MFTAERVVLAGDGFQQNKYTIIIIIIIIIIITLLHISSFLLFLVLNAVYGTNTWFDTVQDLRHVVSFVFAGMFGAVRGFALSLLGSS
jgi:hypothetical protein